MIRQCEWQEMIKDNRTMTKLWVLQWVRNKQWQHGWLGIKEHCKGCEKENKDARGR
jgi:hypothetical protein